MNEKRDIRNSLNSALSIMYVCIAAFGLGLGLVKIRVRLSNSPATEWV